MDFTSIFSKKKKWDWVLILSYDASPISFFENELLNKISITKNLTIVVDEQKFRLIISDANAKARFWGVFYNLEKIKVKNGGAFHPKLYLFLSEDEVVFQIGSPNLTDGAFKKNLEVLLTVRINISTLRDEDIDLFFQFYSFLKETFIDSNQLIESVSPSLINLISEILSSPLSLKLLEQKKEVDRKQFKRKYHLLSSLNKSLLTQIDDLCGNGLTEIHALSPFFDQDLAIFERVKALSPNVSVYVPRKGSTFPKDKFETNPMMKSGIQFYSVDKEDKRNRFIHAKYYRFAVAGQNLDFITSANFTKPGLISDSVPRNLEIGLLLPSLVNEFIDLEGIQTQKLLTFEGLFPDMKANPAPSEETVEILIESAFYVDHRIIIHFDKQLDIDQIVNDHLILILLDQVDSGKYKILKDKTTYFVEPDLEIEGSKTIEVRMVTLSGEFRGISIFVNRLKHNPNYLPVLGTSSYHKCLRIGGLAGIAKAFEFAKSSGRMDWLIYLLSHWNLERILRGIQNNQEEGEEEVDNIPKMPSAKSKHRHKLLRKNIFSLLSTIDMLENLKKFVDELETRSKSNEDMIFAYTQYCFPLFLQVSTYFRDLLSREEDKKRISPFIKYPEYTWLENYHKYEYYLNFIFRKINKILDLEAGRKNTDLIVVSKLLMDLQTEETISHYKRKKDFMKLIEAISEAAKNINYSQIEDSFLRLNDYYEPQAN
ncbi:MAG TPA: hypothetical protein VLX29_08885 [Nitrospirota bacterium]|nr:hypothetical protein [Nitrospirota bacterium]